MSNDIIDNVEAPVCAVGSESEMEIIVEATEHPLPKPIGLAAFEFVGEAFLGKSKKSEIGLRRAKFSAWVKHQFAMKWGDEKPKNTRDRSAFIEKGGRIVLELRYGLVRLKGLKEPYLVVNGDEKQFLAQLLGAIDQGFFDEALEQTAKQKEVAH